ncbi:MAG: 3-isopropylmalate dehydratase small subunit [Firmicutes bacterium]|nr:3-isopropylmalate dehydratase small subunit [Bacillota bacterium]
MIEGRVWVFGDNISTDEITPGRFMDRIGVIPDEEWAKICFIDHEPRFHREVEFGDIIVAGKNFGIGSSREVAPLALKKAGIVCIIAQSLARIFYRNCVNLGLPILTAGKELMSAVKTFDAISVDVDQGYIYIRKTTKKIQATPIPPFAKAIIASGGLLEYANNQK